MSPRLEDDKDDNLDKVWCFLENIRDPSTPQSGCYDDVTWSERDGRYWSSLACFESPDIEGGVKTSPGLPKPPSRKSNPSLTLPIIEEPRSQNKKSGDIKVDIIDDRDDETIPLLNIPPDADDDFSNILNTIFSQTN